MCRGAGYDDGGDVNPVSYRTGVVPSDAYDGIGFRVRLYMKTN